MGSEGYDSDNKDYDPAKIIIDQFNCCLGTKNQFVDILTKFDHT